MIFRRKPKGYWSLVEPYWEAVSIYDGWEVYLASLALIPAASQHLFATHWVGSEVDNGGFWQLFVNSSGVVLPEAVTGFEAIGMPMAAGVAAAAMARLGEPYPRDRTRRNEILEELGDDLAYGSSVINDWNQEFWVHLGEENGGFKAAADRYAEASR